MNTEEEHCRNYISHCVFKHSGFWDGYCYRWLLIIRSELSIDSFVIFVKAGPGSVCLTPRSSDVAEGKSNPSFLTAVSNTPVLIPAAKRNMGTVSSRKRKHDSCELHF